MKCKFCKSKLNPYLLRQAEIIDGNLVFELDCPTCRGHNNISSIHYFLIKKDWEMPKVEPVNNKLPKNMNVIIVSMERCGISWIVRMLSQYHEVMFGSKIVFKPEISPILARKKSQSLPHGWCNVYEVDPKLLLERDYDRVLVVQRDINIQEWVDRIYMAQEGLSQKHIDKIIEKMKKIYPIVYREDIDDPRYLKVQLSDLNNYTVDGFTKLMDFFNFPEYGRPPILPITPPERNWEAYSSILPTRHKLCKRLKKMEKIYNVNRDGLLERIYLDKLKPQKIPLRNILIIGPLLNKQCHFSENIYNEFLKREKFNVEYIGIEDLEKNIMENGTYNYNLYRNKKLLYPLSNVIKKTKERPDLIIIDECGFAWKNDVYIPVFYNHREFKRPPSVFYPNVAFFWHNDVIRYFKKTFAPHWCEHVPHIYPMSIAVNLANFKPEEKTIKGISGLAGREIIKEVKTWGELTAIGILETTLQDNNNFISTGLRYVGTDTNGLTDEQYRESLPKLEGLWVQMPRGQYVSKRIVEAMACKTLCFIKLENDVHKSVLENMGFIDGVHYISFKDWKDLKKENDCLKNYKNIVENAYQVVINNHTYKNRVDFIIELFKTVKTYSYG